MFEKWGRFTHRNRWKLLIVSLVAIAASSVWGPGIFTTVDKAGGFYVPDSESDKAAAVIQEGVGGTRADVVVLYTAEDMTVDDRAYQKAVTESLEALPSEETGGYFTYWSLHEQAQRAAGGQAQAPPAGEDPFGDLVGEDRTSTYAAVEITGEDEQARVDAFKAIKDELREVDGLTAEVGGVVATQAEMAEQTQEDIALAETLSMPVLLLLLLIIFGTLSAALLPLVVAGMATMGSFAALYLISLGTDVSVFAITITTILALILAVDYGLFLVSRYREELAAGRRDEDALGATMATAGRTVAVSGVILMISLGALLLFPQMFLRSMGFGGIATVLVALLGALVMLPALLAVFGTKINSLRVRPRRDPGAEAGETGEKGGWRRVANGVMRRPVIYLLGTLALLVALASPVLNLMPGGVDERVLPEGAETRQVAEQLAADFPKNAVTPIDAVVSGAPAEDVSAYADRLADVPGISSAEIVASEGDTYHVTMGYDLDWQSSEARDLVADVRAVEQPADSEVLVGGRTADLADQFEALTEVLPWAGLLLGGVIFVMLFLSFGSVLLPLKAIAMNLLSVATAFGVLVWIFQDGHFADVLGFTSSGTLDPSSLILILALLFGLSMDYEVFLLSRIREQYDLTGDNNQAVAHGLQRTGGIITAAAVLLLVVVGAFSFSGINFIKMIGIGMVVAITADVLIIRLLMVPAAMRLLGRASWWAPGPLKRLYQRHGIRESEHPAEPAGPAGSAGGSSAREFAVPAAPAREKVGQANGRGPA